MTQATVNGIKQYSLEYNQAQVKAQQRITELARSGYHPYWTTQTKLWRAWSREAGSNGNDVIRDNDGEVWGAYATND